MFGLKSTLSDITSFLPEKLSRIKKIKFRPVDCNVGFAYMNSFMVEVPII